MTQKTNKELYAELDALVKEAQRKLEEAQKFANENELTFSFSPEDAYGMRGTFYPGTPEIRTRWSESKEENYYASNEYYPDMTQGGWIISSMRC